jgi:2-keto-4-pentenoate hydratase/2-oxohepta-3-ene-1,7-dioic acid hydratase in catechol pathway
MRLCRFEPDRVGLVDGSKVHDVTSALAALPALRYPLPMHDVLIEALPGLREPMLREAQRARPVALEDVRLICPVANPGKIIAAPVNYQAHLREVRGDVALHHHNMIHEIHRAGVFLKAPSSLIGPSQRVKIRNTERRTDHEVELAVIIGKPCKRVSRAAAADHIAGYSVALDITERGPEERSLRKSIDTYSVIGPWLVTPDELTDAGALDLSLEVNGELRQKANTSDMILGVPELIEFASGYYQLLPGDIILTGTPQGVGPIRPGDTMLACIDQIGSMRVEVEAA